MACASDMDTQIFNTGQRKPLAGPQQEDRHKHRGAHKKLKAASVTNLAWKRILPGSLLHVKAGLKRLQS